MRELSRRPPSSSSHSSRRGETPERVDRDRPNQNEETGNQSKAQTNIENITADKPTDKPIEENTPSGSSEEVPKQVPEHEIELEEEIINVLGVRLETDKKPAAAVHKDVALRWSEILRKGLPTEEVKKLVEKYPAPENCSFIVVPKLKAEVNAAIQENAIKRDKRIVEKQERIAACLAAVGKAIAITLKIDDPKKVELFEKLSDGGRLLASIHREESLARKGLILANLNSSFKATLSNTSIDEWLFGVDLDEKLKTAKNLEKASKELKPLTKPIHTTN
ncbi:uncharacterized protein LOC143306884 [Osmia lignaria lignaria]|uniref:uncharacterized protein LOC143306884 n=1 Tax=Osmia lignaria lignaria TaxID=1437193 RepID=UPI00402BC517